MSVTRARRPTAAELAAIVDAELRRAGDRARAEGEKRYLKSDLTFYGVGRPGIRQIVGAVLEVHACSAEHGGSARRANSPEPACSLDRRRALAVARALWGPPVHERRSAAIDLLDRHTALLRPSDLALVERFIRQSRTWALVDWLAIPVAGALVERLPELEAELDRWAADPDFWVRRSALLALLPALRRGEGDFARFSRYADAMIDEREFFIAKAIGWVLREVAKKRPALVVDWLLPRARRASGVTRREAVKYLPAPDRDRILRASTK